ncbi:MAG: glycosyltransferase, partial [Streptococcaceae bacterium]|nr:glycosyltransferase [Streptococcaceae bacterium]
ASRLASEKNLDVLIRAVVQAKTTIPELTFDIYGEGKKEPLFKLIKELNAQGYITLKGHHKLKGVYQKYGTYLSASQSEGFGLTILEAIGESLPVIGLNVEYGNTTMVKENGILIEHTTLKENTKKMTEAILQMYQGDFLPQARKKSAQIARNYLQDEIAKKWVKLLEDKG